MRGDKVDVGEFLGGVRDLAADACAAFNKAVPDADGVYYQSVMSTMRSAKSAGFPLNFTWRLVKKYDKQENDGLVARSSAEWGHFLGSLSVPGRRGQAPAPQAVAVESGGRYLW